MTTLRHFLFTVAVLLSVSDSEAARPIPKDCVDGFANLSLVEQEFEAERAKLFAKVGQPLPPRQVGEPSHHDTNRELLKLLKRVLAEVDWETRPSEVSPMEQAFAVIRKTLLADLGDTANSSLKDRLYNSLDLLTFLRSLNQPALKSSPDVAKVVAQFVQFPGGEFGEAFRLMGLALRCSPESQHEKINEQIARFVPMLATLPTPIAAEILREFAGRLITRIMHSPANENLVWDEDDLAPILRFASNAGMQLNREELNQAISHFTAGEKKAALHPFMVSAVRVNDHAETRALLERFLKKKQFFNRSDEERATLFFHLAHSLKLARETRNSDHARLLRNTVEVALKDGVEVLVEELDKQVLGIAVAKRTIVLNRLHVETASHFARASKGDPTTGILAHEVSHILSPQASEQSAGYFEEEMRAWQVGVFAETGRLPNKREAAAHAVYLLSFNGGVLNENDSYSYISSAFKKNPDSFKPYLEALSLGISPQSTVEERQAALRAVSENEPAPQWGWLGYLTNEPPPPSWKKTHFAPRLPSP